MKTVVLGAGYWGRNYVRELAGHVVAVVEPDKTRAEEVSRAFGVPAYPELPKDLDLDAAVVAVPPDLHVRVALPLLKRGLRVLVEKPIATTFEEALVLAPYAPQIMVGHLYMFHPFLADAQAWLQQHALDHVFSRRTNFGPIRPWQDALWDLGAHDISIFHALFGSPTKVQCSGTRNWASLHLHYSLTQTVSYISWLGTPKVRAIEFVPEAPDPDRFIFDDVRTVLEVTPLRRMVDAFLSGEWPLAGFEQGLKVVQTLEEASRCM